MPRIKQDDARQILWRRGILRWKLRDYQVKLYDAIKANKKKRFVVNCSRRWGKTFVMCVLAVEAAIRTKTTNPRIKIATSTAKNLEEFILPAMQLILEDCPPEVWGGWTDGYMRSKKKFLFPNNAEIQLIGLDKDPDGGRGSYCDMYILDEAGYIRALPYLISSVISPMMLGRPGAKLSIISTPSSSPAHPFEEICQKAIKDDYYAEYNIFDNTSITEEERDRIRAEDCETESDWLREYMCQHVVDENLAIIPEWTTQYEQPFGRPEYFTHLHRYVGMDLGVKHDLTAILFGFWDPKVKTLFIEGECHINGPKMTTVALKDLVRAKEKELWDGLGDPYRRVSDSDNPLLIQDLGTIHALYFKATGKDELHAMVNEVRELVKNGRIIINPECKMLIGCLRAGIWNKQRKSFERNSVFGHFDHLAALIYLVRNIDRYSDPVPSHSDVTPQTHYIKPGFGKDEHQKSKQLAQILNLTYKK